MAWHTNYLTENGSSLGSLQNEYPYIFALLQMNPQSVTNRSRNYFNARKQELLRESEPATLPYHIVLDPCDACNLACPLCVHSTESDGRSKTMMDDNILKQVLNEFETSLIRLDFFNWGEPLLHPKFAKIVSQAHSQGIYTRTSSHMYHLKNFQPEAIIDSGLDYFVCSIDGATQETYRKYRIGGEFKVVLKNAQALAEAKTKRNSLTPILDWQYLVMSQNESEIEDAQKLAVDIGFDVFRYGGARGVLANRIRKKTEENFKESSKYLLSGDHPLSEYTVEGGKLHTREYEGCQWLWGKMAIHANGGISPCWTSWKNQDDFANTNDGSIKDIWHGKVFKNARRTATSGGAPTGELICHTCAFNKSFVNPPDGQEEEVSENDILKIAELCRAAGKKIDSNVVNEILKEKNNA
ncbi:MAG: radical SAM protein [Nitrospina sp.]|jgi:MoaA/NifB/PqqE/SkfB family radical SAM enzyme|nr:radical SAM protein [Nitrospina sp.]